ncbi:MAG: ABC transporter ATP-binding protein [Saprospiraceae bacterium]
MKISIQQLSKTYANGTCALDNISLDIAPGMFGLLGPNGAGKSTLMRTLATLQQPTSGTATLGDTDISKDPDAIRRQLGYLPQEFGVYQGVSAYDLLTHLAVLKGIGPKSVRKQTVDYLLERVNLSDQRKKAVSGFSGGMRQRFGIAQALLGDPALVIVDEPTAGLDPGERNRFYNLLSEIGEEKIVILSTHIVQDVEQLCSQLAIINEGRLLFTGSPIDARSELDGMVYERSFTKPALAAIRDSVSILSERLVMGQPLVRILIKPGDLIPEGFQPVEPDLEDVFFAHISNYLSFATQTA